MLTCLNNLIGIRGLNDTDKAYYIDDLTGISLTNADKSMSDKHASGYDLIQTCIANAGDFIKNEFSNHFSPFIQQRTLVENDVAGFYQDNLVQQPPASGLTGLEIMLDGITYAALFINTIRLQVQADGDVTVYIYDLITGKKVKSIVVSVIADEITEVQVDEYFAATKQKINLFIGYEAQATYVTPVYFYPTLGTAWAATSCRACNNYYRSSQYLYVRGANIPTSAQKILKNLVVQSNTYGLSVEYSLQCVFDNLICQMRQALAWAMLYKAGALIMKERLASDRLNSVVLNKKEQVEELRKEYEDLYAQNFDKSVKGIKMPQDICFPCAGKVRNQTVIP